MWIDICESSGLGCRDTIVERMQNFRYSRARIKWQRRSQQHSIIPRERQVHAANSCSPLHFIQRNGIKPERTAPRPRQTSPGRNSMQDRLFGLRTLSGYRVAILQFRQFIDAATLSWHIPRASHVQRIQTNKWSERKGICWRNIS
jgi:hypothetical protein